MTAHDRSGSLWDRQQRAALALLSSDPATVSRAVGVSERTLRRWRAQPEFRQMLRDHARDAARESGAQLLAAQGQAVATLRDAVSAPVAVDRIRAATALLTAAHRAADDDLHTRIEELKAQAWPESRSIA